MNPAVTLANCLTGHMSWGRGGLYMAAQLLGAIFGALIEVCSRDLTRLLISLSGNLQDFLMIVPWGWHWLVLEQSPHKPNVLCCSLNTVNT